MPCLPWYLLSPAHVIALNSKELQREGILADRACLTPRENPACCYKEMGGWGKDVWHKMNRSMKVWGHLLTGRHCCHCIARSFARCYVRFAHPGL